MAIPVSLPSFAWPTKRAAFDDFRRLHTGGPYGPYDRITDPTDDLMLREVLVTALTEIPRFRSSEFPTPGRFRS